jgi:tetraacyldisaccharide 4'-kinase
MLSTLYAAAARRRRERHARVPELRRRLQHPVVSIGNLAVGGRGKTPMSAYVARLLLERGERPAILSRGYARERPADGVVVVRDPMAIRADLARSGDEPLMLARQLPGASVLVCEDRYLAGCIAEHHLGATVHVLDDGLQHLGLDRDLDVILVGRDDVARPLTLPGGRLREPLDTLVVADAIVVEEGVVIETTGLAAPVFTMKRALGPPVYDGAAVGGEPVYAIAGVARPSEFFRFLRASGIEIAGTISFRDHHRYTEADVRRVVAVARAAGARGVLTTEKDYVRLLRFRPFSFPVGFVPLTIQAEPHGGFAAWLAAGLGAARDSPGD